ncbi:hypothetical protein PAQ31011_02014 [Pandoraea aquatica]|uniref:Transmembrane protein n=1 Tax=Pandoraea aquatica TaxID=2508290 RepID=A0A5E4UFN1_9BURK|nr:hypothetical protein [Pandoraea aquatica]VVD98503.1 hypothetical protein PAQ31011_02014 [Pandoraea aquatica]
MRAGFSEGAGPSAQVAPTYRAIIESADDARISIDFPVTPDDVRLRSQTMSRLQHGGLSDGLTGVAITVLGMLGLASGAYYCLEASLADDASDATRQGQWIAVGVGGGMAVLSSIAVTFGLAQICRCMKKQRDAGREMTTLSTRVQFEAARDVRPRDYV